MNLNPHSPIGLLPLVVFSAVLLASSGALFVAALAASRWSALRSRVLGQLADQLFWAGAVGVSVIMLFNILEALR